MRILRSISMLMLFLLAACGGGSGSATTPNLAPANPFQVTKATPNFYKDYTGPQRNSLLAVSAGGFYETIAQNLVLNAQMAGPIVDGNANFYVWGFNRGAATNAPFPDEPNVIFDSVLTVTVTTAGAISATVNLLNGATPAAVTATLSAPDTLEVIIPAANLPVTTTTVMPAHYVWNLWPRNGVGGVTALQVASFIPENAMAPFVSQ